MFSYTNKVIGIFNQKGGVGKTTVGTIIAEYFALVKGKRVLVVDTDMQCNTSDYWVGMEFSPDDEGGQLPPKHPDYDGEEDCEERSTIADIYYGKVVLPHPTYLNGKDHGPGVVDILLGHPKLLEDVNKEFDRPGVEVPVKFRDLLGAMLHDPATRDEYDVVIIDTGPSRTPLFRTSLHAATHAIIPFEPEVKSLQGINAMWQAITSENYSRAEKDRLITLGMIPNKVQRTNLHLEILESIRTSRIGRYCPPEVYLPRAIAFPERDVRGTNPKSIFSLPDSMPARVQSEVLGEYIFQQVLRNHATSLNKATG